MNDKNLITDVQESTVSFALQILDSTQNCFINIADVCSLSTLLPHSFGVAFYY